MLGQDNDNKQAVEQQVETYPRAWGEELETFTPWEMEVEDDDWF